jgi:ribosomal-protein-alanine N-acetyltransferase
MTEIVIDDLKPEDIPDVLSIERVSYSTPWSEILFMNEIYKPLSLPKAARHGDKIVGYICANYVLDEGHILNVTVHPGHRRQGIAEGLVRHVTALFADRGCRAIFLEVRASNEAALAMYRRAGFSLIGARKSYYTHPVEDALTMCLALTDNLPEIHEAR